MILDGNQKTIRQVDWLTEVFEEPYIKDYAAGSVDAWMGAAGFEAVQTKDLFVIHQVTCGMKPIPVYDQRASSQRVPTNTTLDDFGSEGIPAPVF